MDELEKELVEVKERAKSNTHQIEEMKQELKEVKLEQKAIYEISSAVKLMAQSVNDMRDDLNEVKKGQSVLSEKVDQQISEVKNGQATLEGNIRDRISAVDNKSKFDIITLAVKYAIPVLIGGGLVYWVMNIGV